MPKKRRNGRTSTKTSVKDEIAHLRSLDFGALRARWQSVFQRKAPDLGCHRVKKGSADVATGTA